MATTIGPIREVSGRVLVLAGALIAGGTAAWCDAQDNGNRNTSAAERTEIRRSVSEDGSGKSEGSDKVTAQEAPPGELPGGGTKVLLMVVRDVASSNKKYIEEKLGRVVKGAECSVESINAEEISKATYADLERFLVTGRLPNEVQGSLQLEPYVGDGSTWVLDLGNAKRTLTKLIVKTASGAGEDGKKDSGLVFVGSPKTGERKFEMHSVGRYLFKVEEKITPQSYVAEYIDENNSEKREERILPEPQRHWLVKFNQFQGSEQKLFDTLRNNKQVNNPVPPNVQKGPAVTVVIADLNPVAAEEGGGWSKNQFTIRFNTVPGVETKRVLMKFPLKPQDLASEKQKYDSLNEFDLVRAVEKEKVPPGDEPTVLTPDMKPQWYVIPWNPGSSMFERTFTVDVEKWKDAKRFEVHRLHYFEHETPGGDRSAIRLKNSGGGRGTHLISSAEEKQWPSGLRGTESSVEPNKLTD